MSISPPSDIILDVARAADPVREQRAIARLSQMAPAAEGESFGRILDAGAAEAAATKPAPPPPETRPMARPPVGPVATDAGKAFQSFEAMALATMIEAAMPKDGDTIFGSGTAGSAWKSMLAQQIGVQMAEAGGIGMAEQLASSAARLGQAPGESDQIGSIAESLLVTQIERGFVGAAMPDAFTRDEERSS
jgi:hypothetical protein